MRISEQNPLHLGRNNRSKARVNSMDNTLGSLFPHRRPQPGTKPYKHVPPEKSPSLKRPQLFSSMKGLMHRKTRSVGNMRPKKSITKITHISFAPRSQRSQSLDLPAEPPSFQKKGQTPGMGDYLTMAQLENVWETNRFTLGSPDVPQTASEYTYTYTEPVELGTFVKHQRPEDDASAADLPRPSFAGSGSPPQEPAGAENESQWSICPPFAAQEEIDTPTSRSPSPARGRRRENLQEKPVDKQKKRGFLELPQDSPLPLRVRTRPSTPEPPRERGGRQASLDPHMIPNPRRPSTAPSHDSASQPPASPKTPPKRRTGKSTGTRHEVISGVLHPALRPIPYISPPQVAASSCRSVTSRFAVDVPRNHMPRHAEV